MKFVFTGHRPNKLRNDYDLKSPFVMEIKRRIIEIVMSYEDSNKEFITGMALGIDQLAAQIALELSIHFTAAIPCFGQESMWPKKSQDKYHELLQYAKTIIHVTMNKYNNTCMQKRNEWMVNQMDRDDILIAVWDGSPGGTKNCIDYAKRRNKTIVYIMLETISL
jgi:uncharacterized phage-like protein YoqJ